MEWCHPSTLGGVSVVPCCGKGQKGIRYAFQVVH